MQGNENPIVAKFKKNGSDVANPAKVSDFDEIAFSISQSEFFAEGFVATQTAEIVFQLESNTAPIVGSLMYIKFNQKRVNHLRFTRFCCDVV